MPLHKPSWAKGSNHAVFPYLAKLFDLKTFIETGTGFGDTLAFVHPVFDDCYSIESDEWKYSLALEQLRYHANVHLLFGSSATVLPELLSRIPVTPTFFWLDAHLEIGAEDDPLPSEVQTIQALRPDALIAIDDVGLGTHHDTKLSRITTLGDWKLDYRFKRIMFVHHGQYQIPNLD